MDIIKKYLIIIILMFVCSSIGCSNSNSNIKEYLSRDNKIDSKAKDVMPSLESLPEYEDIKYVSTHRSMVLFESDSIALIVSYDDDTYENEKSKLDDDYVFLKQEVKSKFDETKYYITENEFSINSYKFRVIDDTQSSNIEYPKSFGIIGTSDEKNSVAYLYFYDFDLDYIGKEDKDSSMANFVKEYFKCDF
ncbi:hypothetical protein [Clostridium butyricum]|uniref:hypothetical protein n=1 Tax=Clostridium butyricum TaxID=1492 RepID=UPI002ABE82BC|nr:hypothetical protein [Clostridium butyricum]